MQVCLTCYAWWQKTVRLALADMAEMGHGNRPDAA
jgi:hypothetical protein